MFLIRGQNYRHIRCRSILIISDFSRRLYIHCHGGVGRTGMIVACVLARLWNLDADEALDEMRRRFAAHARSSWMSAPETEAQIDFVRAYAAYKRSRE